MATGLVAGSCADPKTIPAGYRLPGVLPLLLVIGIGSIPITTFVPDKDQIENVMGWDFALLLQLNYLLAWRKLARPNLPSETASDWAARIADER